MPKSISTKDIKPTNKLVKYQLKSGEKYLNGNEIDNRMRVDDKGRAFFAKGGNIYYVTHEKASEAITDEIIEALHPNIEGSRFFELVPTQKAKQ